MNTLEDVSVVSFKSQQSKDGYVIECARGFYLTFDSDYSGTGWGWTDELSSAAHFPISIAYLVCSLSAKECSRWAMEGVDVADAYGKRVITTKESDNIYDFPF